MTAEAGRAPRQRMTAGRAVLVMLAWLALTAILVGVGELVMNTASLKSFDRHVTSLAVAHRSAALDSLMKAVTWLGSWVALLVVAVVLGFSVVRRRQPVAFLVVAIVAWAGTQGATTLTKHLVRRNRPPERLWLVRAHGWSWPSGHAATAALVFIVLALVVVTLVSATWIRIVAAAGAMVAVAAVACSRVVLGVHWATDVIAGVAFVGAWLAVLGFILRDVVDLLPRRLAAPSGTPATTDLGPSSGVPFGPDAGPGS